MGAHNGWFVKHGEQIAGKAIPQLGQLLLKGGHIIPQDLEFALEHQKYTNDPLGDILVRMGALHPDILDQVLFVQTSATQC